MVPDTKKSSGSESDPEVSLNKSKEEEKSFE